MNNGELSEVGKYDELLAHKGPFADFIATHLNQAEEDEDEDPEGTVPTFNSCTKCVGTPRMINDNARLISSFLSRDIWMTSYN